MVGRAARLVLLVAAFALLAGCSVARIAYTNATPAIAWMVDDWVDLQDGQRDWLKERVGRLLAWHRESELPEAERLLQETAMRSARGLAAEDARWVYQSVRGLYRRTMAHAIPDMADFLLQLKPEQIAHLERKFAEDQEKAVKESLKGTPAERTARRAKRFVEGVEDWTGKLAPAQRDLVTARVKAMADVTEDWLADRRHRQLGMLSLVKSKAPREATIAGLRHLLLDTDAWRRPDYIEKLRVRDEQLFAMVAALDATLDAEQRARLQKKIRGYAADVAYLMAQR